MMPLGAPSISKYGSLVRPDAQIDRLPPSLNPLPPSRNPLPPSPNPLPTLSHPLPTLSQPLPTHSHPLPNLSQPSATLSQPSPTLSNPLPTLSNPLPTISHRLPTLSQPSPTLSQPSPNPLPPTPNPLQPSPTLSHHFPVLSSHPLLRAQASVQGQYKLANVGHVSWSAAYRVGSTAGCNGEDLTVLPSPNRLPPSPNPLPTLSHPLPTLSHPSPTLSQPSPTLFHPLPTLSQPSPNPVPTFLIPPKHNYWPPIGDATASVAAFGQHSMVLAFHTNWASVLRARGTLIAKHSVVKNTRQGRTERQMGAQYRSFLWHGSENPLYRPLYG